MTTKPKGITLPAPAPYTNITGIGLFTTDTLLPSGAGDYTVKNAWKFLPGGIAPFNPAILTAAVPTDFNIVGQDANAGFSAIGGAVNIFPGVGTAGAVSGNVRIADTGGNGGSWNKSHLVLGSNHLWIDALSRLRIKTTAPTTDLDGNVVNINLSGTAVYDPPSLVDGAGVTTTVACAGAVLGDFALVSFSNDLQGILVKAYVSAANVVAVRFQNETTGTIDLASGNLAVRVIKA